MSSLNTLIKTSEFQRFSHQQLMEKDLDTRISFHWVHRPLRVVASVLKCWGGGHPEPAHGCKRRQTLAL